MSAYRESDAPTIDMMKSEISRLDKDLDRLIVDNKRLRKNTLSKIAKGGYLTVLGLGLIMTFYRWGVVKENRQELEKHYTKYHDSLIKRQEQSAAVKEQKKFDKQQGLVFSALNKWTQKYVDVSTIADSWCNITEEEQYDPNQYFKCAILLENAPYISIYCSTKKCYRQFDK